MPSHHDRIAWQAAGYELANGRLDRPVSSAELVILPAKLEGDDVASGTNWTHVKFRRPGKGLLSDFLRLRTGDHDGILRFVRNWGAINFGRAIKHYMKSTPFVVTEARTLKFTRDWIGTTLHDRHSKNRDPIDAYKGFSQRVHQILRLAKDVDDEQVTDAIWEKRYPYHCDDCLSGRERAIDEVRLNVDDLIELGNVRFVLARDDDEDRWRTTVAYGAGVSTLGALAMQIVLMISRADSLYTCSGCGTPYIRTFTHHRRPKPNQNNYCPECGGYQARLAAKKRYRQKIQEARRMDEAGISVNRIAEQLDTEPENVKNWLQGFSDGQRRMRKQ